MRTAHGYPMVSVTEVDRAWKHGYEAGRTEKPWHKLTSGRSTVEIALAVLIAVWAWKDRRAVRQWGLILIPWLLAAILVVLPFIVLAVGVETGRRQYLRHKNSPRDSGPSVEPFEPYEPPMETPAVEEKA